MGSCTQGNPRDYYQLDRAELYAFARKAGFRTEGRALNVGCGAGQDADHLRRLGATVIHGIEPIKSAADVARSNYDAVFQGKVEEWEWDGNGYHLIVFADVLEHTPEPDDILRRARSWLSPGGMLLISIPNVRHVSVLYDLVVCGEWAYAEHGIMDKTHLRFFTSRSFGRLLGSSGYVTRDVGRWGATRTARTVARVLPGSGEFLLSQVFFLARALPE